MYLDSDILELQPVQITITPCRVSTRLVLVFITVPRTPVHSQWKGKNTARGTFPTKRANILPQTPLWCCPARTKLLLVPVPDTCNPLLGNDRMAQPGTAALDRTKKTSSTAHNSVAVGLFNIQQLPAPASICLHGSSAKLVITKNLWCFSSVTLPYCFLHGMSWVLSSMHTENTQTFHLCRDNLVLEQVSSRKAPACSRLLKCHCSRILLHF